MNWLPYIAPLVTAVLGGLGAWFLKPKLDAEAAKLLVEAEKLRAEAADIIVARLYRHIDRIDTEMEEMREKFAKFQKASSDEKEVLERENKSLRSKVARLETRVTGLERIFKTHPITPEMQAELDKLDRIA